jgi:ppGpp synthetase/RelA/SpoT-type nucleotidyltranferase
MSMPAGDLAAYRELRPLYADFARCLKTLLDEALRSDGVKTQSVEPRAKTLDSFARKAGTVHPLDPSRPKYEDPLRDITDMAGVRVITYLPKAVDQVVFAVRDQFDVIRQEDKFERLAREERFGYASVHLLAKLKPNRTSLLEYRRFADLVGEIQVRTVLQHAWAELEHDILYKGAQVVPASVRRGFTAAAVLLELADREFQAIEDEVRRRRRVAAESVEEGRLDRAELSAEALRSYLERRLGADRRVGDTNYETWARVLQDLGFRTLQQVDECIAGLDGDAISRNIWGARRPQLQRFEGMLLAGMGEYYIEHHPSHGLDQFAELRWRWLERLREHGGPVRGYRPHARRADRPSSPSDEEG